MFKSEKIKQFFKIFFDNNPISYIKLHEFFSPVIEKNGKQYNDLCLYRMTQCFDDENKPSEFFYYSNHSLGENTTYQSTTAIEFTKNYNLLFNRRENNHGLFNKNSKTKLIRYWGKSRKVVNSPYILNLNFGDYLALSNNLLMFIPKNKKKELFVK